MGMDNANFPSFLIIASASLEMVIDRSAKLRTYFVDAGTIDTLYTSVFIDHNSVQEL